MAVNELREPLTYGNWRKPTSPGLLGLGSLGTGLLFGGLVIVVIAVATSGILAGLVAFTIVALAVGAVSHRDRDGKNALSRFALRVAWWSARANGSHLYRSGPLGRVPWGTYQLPGLAAPIRLSEHRDSYDRPFALLHTPATSSFTVVFGSEPDGSSLVDQDQVDVWVGDWGRWLARLADEPGIEAASVTIETAPDLGTRLRQEVELNLDPDAPPIAQSMLREVVERYPAASSSVRAYIAITFNASPRAGAPKRSPEEMGRALATRLPGLTSSLGATGAGAARPLSAAEMCEIVRTAYDPRSAALIEEAHARGEDPGLRWPDVGPVSVDARWDSMHHDSAVSTTWAMTEAPRGVVQSGVLKRFLAPHRDIARKRVTILYRPMPPARAAAIAQADLRAAEFRRTSTPNPPARDVLAARAARQTESEEAAGAGLVSFGLVATATVMNLEDREAATAAMDNLSATARLHLRCQFGSQDSAFAAALPLGLVLPRHLKVPAEIRERL